MAQENLWMLVHLGESSRLKIDLNKGMAALFAASETQVQPHVCLNALEGVEVLEKISHDPVGANTEFWMRPHPIVSGDDLWLNVRFDVFLDQICWPTNVAHLSPRQSAYVVKNLPPESQSIVLEKVRTWYLEKFLADIKKGLGTITEQFNHGDLLLASDHRNRIFDVHGERAADVPYTECEVVGEQLFWAVVYGGTLWEHDQDGYQRADHFISARRSRQKAAVDDTLSMLRRK